MTPFQHSALSVRDFGGKIKHYIEIHKFLDSTKFQFTDYRHRAILHNPFGMDLCEKMFGDYVQAGKKKISVREIARRHIVQDCGLVPTTKEWMDAISNGEAIKFNNPNRKDLLWLKENNF